MWRRIVVVHVALASANFLTSLHTNYVINLDFEAAEPVGEDVKTLNLAKGQRKFRCRLPGGNATQEQDLPDAKKHFLAAKLTPFRGTCMRSTIDFWHYDLCFGSRVVQFRDDAGLRFSLGDFHAGSERLLPSGEVRELYLFGTDNRSTEVRYLCGPAGGSFEVVEDPVHFYQITLRGPAFCTWKEKEGAQAVTFDGEKLPVSSLLEPLRGKCLNITQQWWTYEYCYPMRMVQFHVEGDKRSPQYTLGTLQGTNQPREPNQVNMSLYRMNPSNIRERRGPSRYLTLEQRLGGGDVCDETNRHRKTTINFRCPQNWQSRPEDRIAALTESSLCEYHVLVQTTLLCGHHRLMPLLPRGKETIQCVAQDKEL